MGTGRVVVEESVAVLRVEVAVVPALLEKVADENVRVHLRDVAVHRQPTAVSRERRDERAVPVHRGQRGQVLVGVHVT